MTVTGNGTYYTPNGYTPGAGVTSIYFHWTASYSGDANNTPATTGCTSTVEYFPMK